MKFSNYNMNKGIVMGKIGAKTGKELHSPQNTLHMETIVSTGRVWAEVPETFLVRRGIQYFGFFFFCYFGNVLWPKKKKRRGKVWMGKHCTCIRENEL